MVNYVYDQTFLLYLVSVVTSGFGFLLFLWYLMQMGWRASVMYICVMGMFLGNVADHGVSLIARAESIQGDLDGVYDVVTSWYWPAKMYLTNFFTMLAVGIASFRYFILRKT